MQSTRKEVCMKHLFLVMQQTQEKRFRCSFQNGTGDVLAESN